VPLLPLSIASIKYVPCCAQLPMVDLSAYTYFMHHMRTCRSAHALTEDESMTTALYIRHHMRSHFLHPGPYSQCPLHCFASRATYVQQLPLSHCNSSTPNFTIHLLQLPNAACHH
jgi:hypothetical protein